LRRVPDDATAERWFEATRWPDGRFCLDCGSINNVSIASRKPMPYRCRDCQARFLVRKGTVMQSSKLGLQKWAIALYMMTTGVKGTSSMKLYQEVGIRQATAWLLMRRIRGGFIEGYNLPFPGPVEADETAVGGERLHLVA
jgi:transposase-like protein